MDRKADNSSYRKAIFGVDEHRIVSVRSAKVKKVEGLLVVENGFFKC